MPERYFQRTRQKKNEMESVRGTEKEANEKAEKEGRKAERTREEQSKKEEGKNGEDRDEAVGTGSTAEVLAVGEGGGEERGRTGMEGRRGKEKEVWDVWEESDWYGELTRFLLCGDFAGTNLGVYERRRIRIWGRRFVLFDGRKQRGLFYTEKDGRLSLCILPDDVMPTLKAYHNCHGHFAGRLLIQFLLGKVYWPTRAQDCHYYARTFPDCQSMGPIRPSAGIKPIVHLQPFDMVGLDFIGQITPTSVQGNRFIIIMVDYFTRFLFAKAILAATGDAARGLLETAVKTFGRPLAVYTDNGQHFLGEEFHGTLSRWGVKHFPAPKTHQSSVGLAERYVQLVMGILKRRIQGSDKRLWDTLLASAVRTLNTRGVEVHAFMPSELLLGYNPRSGPIDDINAHILNDAIDEHAYGIHLARVDEQKQQGQERIVAAAERQMEREKQRDHLGMKLTDRDLVLLRRFDVAKHHGMKLESQWEGPYRLVDLAFHNNSGRLQDITTGEIVRVRKGGLKERVHVNDLKLFVQHDWSQIPAVEADAVELQELGQSCGWEPGKRKFEL